MRHYCISSCFDWFVSPFRKGNRVQSVGNPIISTSAHIPDEEGELFTLSLEKARLFDALDPLVDIIIDTEEEPGFKVSTILDFTGDTPALVRKGLGWEELESWIDVVDLSEED